MTIDSTKLIKEFRRIKSILTLKGCDVNIDSTKLIKEFRRIKSLGFIPNVKSDSNDGGAGNTFESLLGVRENNSKDADFEGFEIKTKKNINSKTGKSYTSLFTRKPSFPEDGDSYMRENWGVPDSKYKKVLCFRTSLYANRWSVVYKKYKYKVEVNRREKKVFLVKANLDEKVIDKTVYWTFEDINHGAKKLENMFYVSLVEKSIKGKLHFNYVNATVLIDYHGKEKFIDLLEDGTIRYDNRLGVYGENSKQPGLPHNHGGGFRVSPNNLTKLYGSVIEIE